LREAQKVGAEAGTIPLALILSNRCGFFRVGDPMLPPLSLVLAIVPVLM
jgi:hypothetical protein